MPNLIDLSGMTFGRVVVLKRDGVNGGGAAWRCRCSCGTEFTTRGQSLKRGATTSCGCRHDEQAKLNCEARLIDLTGRTFGRLTVVEIAVRAGRATMWRCQCSCGSYKDVRGSCLLNDMTKSCGCLRRETSGKARLTHGLSGMKEYGIWKNMRRRCLDTTNPAYPRYGGRDISISDEWASDFSAFMRDMGPRPFPEFTLERKDNDQGYSKDNCIWATSSEQARNRRSTVYVTINGDKIPLMTACEIYGLNDQTIRHRSVRLSEDLTASFNHFLKRKKRP